MTHPLIWAGGPFSGRLGGEPALRRLSPSQPRDELAWRTRIEGSQGIPERERLGPVVGLQEQLPRGSRGARCGLRRSSPPRNRIAGCKEDPEFLELLREHACEGMYGAPEYLGNRNLAGWRYIGFEGDVQPRGYTDEEVSKP